MISSKRIITASLAVGVGIYAINAYSQTQQPAPQGTQVQVSKAEEIELSSIDAYVSSFFTPKAQECIQGWELQVWRLDGNLLLYGNKPGGTIDIDNKIRIIEQRIFNGDNARKSVLHENIHVEDIVCNLIDRQKFLWEYTNMDPIEYPIKTKIAERLGEYDPEIADIEGEKIAYTAQYWIAENYEVSPGMEEVLSPVLEPYIIVTLIKGNNPQIVKVRKTF